MAKKKYFIVFDCETATLPIATEIARNAEEKKRIAIAKPLIYDMGWTITDRQGNIYDRKQFLIAETFSVPAVFNTAYYAEKRPLYIDMLARGEITIRPWHDAIAEFISDLEMVDAVGAFNSMFDFKKAIPFTELYINKLYSKDYYTWENIQRQSAQRIANGVKPLKNDPDFENDVFRFRGKSYPLFDLWGLATAHLLNNATYKKKCIENSMLTASGTFFKTSAESTYRYLTEKYDFDEAHTALDDATIETFILSKIAKRHAINPGITFFPFRDLGYTDEFVMRRKVPNMNECNVVYNAIRSYMEQKENEGKDDSSYYTGLAKRVTRLAQYMFSAE